MVAAKPEQKVKVQKSEVVKREGLVKREAETKVKRHVKDEAKAKVEELVRRGLDLRAKAEEAKRVKPEMPSRVKREGKAKPRKKQRVTAKRRNASREVMNRPVALSEELGAFLGETSLSRPETVSRIWAYAKDKGLKNPSNSREIRCDSKLKKLLGVETTSMLQLGHQLMPHFDYTIPVERPEPSKNCKKPRKSEPKAEAKEEAKVKGEKKEELKEEKVKSASSKSEQVKRDSSTIKAASAETAEALAKGLTLRPTGLLQQQLSLEFTIPELDLQQLQFEFVALPCGKSTGSGVRRACRPGAREAADGAFESFAEGKLDGLHANSSYTVFVEVQGAGRVFRSTEVAIPQRNCPQKWTPNEVLLWAAALRVPEFSKKLSEYAVDGATLLTLGEADLKAFGLAPFLIRRVSQAIHALDA